MTARLARVLDAAALAAGLACTIVVLTAWVTLMGAVDTCIARSTAHGTPAIYQLTAP